MKERKILYIFSILFYSTVVVRDWLISCILLSALLLTINLINFKIAIIANQILLIADVCLKLPSVQSYLKESFLDTISIDHVIHLKITKYSLSYCWIQGLNLFMLLQIIKRKLKKQQTKPWGPFMTQLAYYFYPVCLYCLGLMSKHYWQCVAWSLLGAFQMFDLKMSILIPLVCCSLVVIDNLLGETSNYMINVSGVGMSEQNIIYVQICMKIMLILFCNVKSNPFVNQQQESSNGNIKSFTTKKHLQEQQENIKIRVLIIIILSIALCLVTNSPGNVFVVIAIFTNLPSYKTKRFSFLMSIGLVISIALEPKQLPYFIYLYVVLRFLAKNPHSLETIEYGCHSYSIFVQLYGLYLLLYRVSFLNFLIGIFRYGGTLTLVLICRIIARYLGINDTFLGTNDGYGFEGISQTQSLSDGILWGYFILLCLYEPQKTQKYKSSNITNLLAEYEFLGKTSKLFTVLRVFNWISYVIFSLLILSKEPSFYIFLHILFLLIVVGAETIANDLADKNILLKWCWTINLYMTTFMIFTKYFYLLKQYDNTSPIIKSLLDLLTQYKTLIGLTQIPPHTSGGLALFYTLFYDGIIILLSWINIYILEIKIYEAYRDIVFGQQHLEEPLVEKQEEIEINNIHFFYKSYIKSLDIRLYLEKPKFKLFSIFARDLLSHVYFLIITVSYSFDVHHYKIFIYIPHFFIAMLYYFSPAPQNPSKFIAFSIIWSLFAIMSTYLSSIFYLINNQKSPDTLPQIISTYLMSVFGCIFYHIISNISMELLEKEGHFLQKLLPWYYMNKEIPKIYFFGFECLSKASLLVCLLAHQPTLSALNILFAILFYLIEFKDQEQWLKWLRILTIFNIYSQNFCCIFPFLFISLYFNLKICEPQIEQDKDFLNAYCTFIQYFPLFMCVLGLLGSVWLSPSLFTSITIPLFFIHFLLLILTNQQLYKINEIMIAIGLLLLTIDRIQEYFPTQNSHLILPHQFKFGLLIFLFSQYFSLEVQKLDYYKKRKSQSIAYWKEKSQLVGELGSQLHNEKKILILRKYFEQKELLNNKIFKISSKLSKIRNNEKEENFQSLPILPEINQEEKQHHLFSNIFVFMSIQELRECFILFNQYYKNKSTKKILTHASKLRQNIKKEYSTSICQILPFHIQEMENSRLNIEKISEMNEDYEKCFRIINKNAMQFNYVCRLIIEHFQMIGLVILVGWNLWGGVYTIPINICVFGWAIVLENKTNIVFWMFTFCYAMAILFLKQIYFFYPQSYLFNFIFYFHSNDFLYEFAVCFVSILQIILINFGGIKRKSYSQRQSIYDAFYRATLNRASKGIIQDKQSMFMDTYKNLSQPNKHSFIYRVFSKARFKPGRDFYPLMSGIQLIILLYLFFFYDLMEFESRKNRRSFGELLTMTNFSSHMVVALFISVMIMIIDRLLVSLNLVDKTNKDLQDFFLNFTFRIGQIKQNPPETLDHFGVFDFLLILKYLFHLFLLFFINFVVYFYIPSAGLTKSLIPECNTIQCDKSYTYLSIFLVLYFAYFLASGLQIKYGFNRNKCRNVLMENYHYVGYYIYKAFTAIPFAWEFKKICDWTVTSTALPLFHWMKFEDINARLYQSKCEAEMLKMKPIGTPWNKYILGPSGCFAILFLVFSPFLIYSPMNPFAVKDTIIGAQIQVLLRIDNHIQYKFFQTSHVSISQENKNIEELDLSDKNLFKVKVSKYPDETFLLSEPTIQKLSDKIEENKNKFSLLLKITVIEKEGGQKTIDWAKKTLNETQLQKLHEMLTFNPSQMIVENFYSPFPGRHKPLAVSLVSFNQCESFEFFAKPAEQSNIYFYYFTSNKFKVGFGVVTFYLTYVLLVSRLLRFYFSGIVDNIIYEGWHVQKILVLCQGVRSARIVENFRKQEEFYFQLIDLMRSPKLLKAITGEFSDLRKQKM